MNSEYLKSVRSKVIGFKIVVIITINLYCLYFMNANIIK